MTFDVKTKICKRKYLKSLIKETSGYSFFFMLINEQYFKVTQIQVFKNMSYIIFKEQNVTLFFLHFV